MRWLLLCLAVAVVNGYVVLRDKAYIQLEDANGGKTLNASIYNRLAFDPATNLLYSVARNPARLQVFTLAFDGTPTQVANIKFDILLDGEPLDIEFCRPFAIGGVPRLAITFEDPASMSGDGSVRFYRAMTPTNPVLNFIQEATVGAMPLDMEFAEDCNVLVIANLGRPSAQLGTVRDPEGTISKILIPFNFNENSPITITNIGFGSLFTGPGSDEYLMSRVYFSAARYYGRSSNDTVERTGMSLMEENFRITPIRNHLNQLLTVAQNIEPSNIIVAPNGRVAYVALAKNNAIARINLDTNLVSTIYPLGNRSWSNYYMDASDRDNAISMRGYNIHTTYQARQLKWLTQGNSQWLLSLDSGFLNEVPEYSYRDWERGKTLLESGAIDTSDSVLRSQLNNDALLGRAAVSKDDGRGPDGTIENVFLFGGRGISIRDGDTMEVRTTLVDNIERMAAQYHEEVFNTRMESPSDTPQGNRDSTSPLLGPSLTFMETGIFQGNRVLFLGSAHSGIIYVYVLSADANCPQPFFHSTHRRGSTFSSWDTLFAQGTIGDLGISDMLYLSDDDLTPVLAVASSLSNSLSIYSVVEAVIDITP